MDRAASYDEECGFECEECLDQIAVDLNAMTLTTSAGDDSNSSCVCPTFKYNIIGLHDLEIVDSDGHKHGDISRGGNREHVLVYWTDWMGNTDACSQKYYVSIEDFLTVSSISCWYAINTIYQ